MVNVRRAEHGINLTANIDGLIQLIAAGKVFVDIDKMSNIQYLDTIVDNAFNDADDLFNTTMASIAKTTDDLNHMYEWGTVGVNYGRSNMRRNPEDPSSRLWNNYVLGSGLDRRLTWVYLPSVANVPKPTKRDTGMSTEVIAKMKNHVFYNKAQVMEEGRQVTIMTKGSNRFLLIPAYEENRRHMRPNDIKRGYSLQTHSIRTYPGRYAYKGNFTKYWSAFWSGQGIEAVETSISRQLVSDFTPEFNPVRPSGVFTPVGAGVVRSGIKKKEEAIRRHITVKAKARKVRKNNAR